MSNILKKITILSIKYGPIILVLTCCLKIHLLAHSTQKDNYELSVNIINWLLNISTIIVLYCAGIYFGFCWKHQSLCRISLWGYSYYILFLILKVPHEAIYSITLWYVIFVLTVTILYKWVF